MRKVFSYFVLALCLLVSTQVKAVNVSTEAQLRSAIEAAAPGATVDITLSNDIALGEPLQIYVKYAQTGKTINLDLNGNTLSNNPSKNISVIELFKGTLNVSNGTIRCQWPTDASKCKDAIIVHGMLEEVSNWSTLDIAKDVKVFSDNNAITLLEFVGIPYKKFAWADSEYSDAKCNSFTYGTNATWNAPDDFTTKYPAYRFAANTESPDKTTPYSEEHKNGYNYRYNNSVPEDVGRTSSSGKTVPTDIDYTSQFPSYSATVKVSNTKGDGSYSDISAQCYRNCVDYVATAAANGATINISGYVYGKKYGVKVNGTIREKSSNPLCAAKVNIFPSAEIVCSDEAIGTGKEAIAVYCSGAAEWTINGYLHGNIGVVVKSGKVEIENATIEATGTAYEAVTYEGGSGLNGGAGCAVVVASQSNYSGGQDVTIKGDTKISATSGFAVNEVVVTGVNKTSAIAIEGGTFESGAEGTMLFTNETVTEGKISIMGGNVGEGSIYQGATPITLEQLLEKTAGDHYVTEIEVDDEKIFVINNGTEPAAKNFDEIAAGGSAIVNAGTPTLSADKKFGDLQFTNATTLTINNNAVMQAEKIVMGPSAQIIVTPGAKLFVTGSAGLYAPVDENLVIKADGDGMGMFLFDPAVASNRTPHATVEVYADEAYAYGNEIGYSFEIISCPFSSVSSITYELDAAKTAEGEGGVWSSMQIWKNNNWVQVTRAEAAPQLKAFQPIALTSSADTDKGGVIKYTFKGILQGNVSGIMPIGKNFNYMGNAYLAPMSAAEFINKLEATDMLENNMWFWKGQGFQPVTADKVLQAGNIAPLGMFILKSKGSVNYEMDYETLIWNLNKPVEE